MERILRYASLIYGLLVFAGYLNLHTYYSKFGIQIWPYLSTSELLLSFLPLGLLLSVYALVIVAALMLPRPTVADVSDKPDREVLYHAFKLWNFRRNVITVFLNVTFLLVVGGTDLVRKDIRMWVAISGILMTTTTGYLLALFHHLNKKHWVASYSVVALGLGMLWLAVWNGVVANEHIARGVSDRVRLVTEEGTYETSDRVCYVGRVNSTVFLYDRKDSTAIAIPTSDIKEFRIHRDQTNSISN